MTCSIEEARLCRECYLVTVDAECDLCRKPTIRHPEADEVDRLQYCIDCGDEVLREKAVVRTWKDDAYGQCDGMLITVCRGCEMDRDDEMEEDQENPQQ
jgi:hypothetical protein